ncbi:hypothetical protein DPMN_156966 [Dreissena polymorpha]|uniref:Uncharacterized protein n=1 Tax=Dreissena polymorpha TaxID=45954 RepID=A0A9D4FTA7_DREPO|nr:hypothetical protein DPMN_156966 [Dreissena polymorpha]
MFTQRCVLICAQAADKVLKGFTNAPPPGGLVFQPTQIIFKLQDIRRMNLLTNFYEDQINEASRVLTMKYAPPPGGNFQATGIILKHVQDINGTNLRTKFHDNRTIHVAYTVLTMKNAPLPWRPSLTRKNLVAMFFKQTFYYSHKRKSASPPGCDFHEDRAINVASRVLTRFYYSHIWKRASPPGGHVFQPTDIILMFTRKNAPPLGSHVF